MFPLVRIFLSLTLFNLITAQIYHVKDFNATGDGLADDTNAVRAALNATMSSNGGRVIFDEGYTFLTGCFQIYNNVILDVRGTILGSNESDHYVLYGRNSSTAWNSFISSYYTNNITITGGGIIDGQGYYWWQCVKDPSKPPCSGKSRPNLVWFFNASNINFNNITFKNSPMFTVHLLQSNNVKMDNIAILNPSSSVSSSKNSSINTDGIHFDSVQNAVIENSYISTGDDAFGFDSDIGLPPTENIVVRNINIGASHGLSIGAVTRGGIQNVLFENIVMNGSLVGPNIRSRPNKGGLIQNITFRNIQVYNVVNCIKLEMAWDLQNLTTQNDTISIPSFKNISIYNLTCDNPIYGLYIDGLDNNPINANFSNIKITNMQQGFTQICQNIYGSCDNSTFIPYCPSCMTPTECKDSSNDCSNYLGQCNNPAYHNLLCNQCRKTCKLCDSCESYAIKQN